MLSPACFSVTRVVTIVCHSFVPQCLPSAGYKAAATTQLAVLEIPPNHAKLSLTIVVLTCWKPYARGFLSSQSEQVKDFPS